ncbi:MAG: DUF1801 domain-containing protein, partial [Bacteroidetes bacterium]|nr:DUF1801 domain-containing protein [Bacteroidota bacterium]
MTAKKFLTIDAYHSAFPEDVRSRLDVFRKIISEAAPKAEEVISYNMPAFKLNAVFVYYSAYKKHISLFPAPGGKEWEDEFAPYPTSGRGTIQFPFDRPLPIDLIKKIVKHLVN